MILIIYQQAFFFALTDSYVDSPYSMFVSCHWISRVAIATWDDDGKTER